MNSVKIGKEIASKILKNEKLEAVRVQLNGPFNSISFNLLINFFSHLPEDGGRGFSLKTRQVRRTESPRPFVCSRPTTFSVPPSLSRSPELSCVREIKITLRQIALFHPLPSILDL